MQEKLTQSDIDGKIVDVRYIRPEGTPLTICVLTLENGFYVVGTSCPVTPALFDKTKGEEIALAKAKSDVWALEGYLLREKHYRYGPSRITGTTISDIVI